MKEIQPKEFEIAPGASWLVTGGAGFIGSHLVRSLLGFDQRVVVVDNFQTGKRANLAAACGGLDQEQVGRLRVIEGDLADPAICDLAVEGVDFVLHQAALGSVPGSIDDPVGTHGANVEATVRLLDAARRAGVRRLVYASSSAVYGDDARLPKVEGQEGRVLSPYAAHKAACELNAGVYSDCYGIETVGLRYFNVYGARQDPRGAYAAVIPQWISTMLGGETVKINGDGETSRDFVAVADVVRANLMAATRPLGRAATVCNVASGQATSLNQLYALLRRAVEERRPGLEVKAAEYRDFRHGDIRHSHADTALARKLIGFEAEVAMEEGIDMAMDWYIASEAR